jgi:hypothetical protein
MSDSRWSKKKMDDMRDFLMAMWELQSKIERQKQRLEFWDNPPVKMYFEKPKKKWWQFWKFGP